MNLTRLAGRVAVAAILAVAALGATADSIGTNQALAKAGTKVYGDHTRASNVRTVLNAGARVTLETGPYGVDCDWWFGKVNATGVKGWIRADGVNRLTKQVPAGVRWIDVTIDDQNKLYQARLMAGTTVVDVLNVGVGAIGTPTPTPSGVYMTVFREPSLFELEDHPGVFLRWWQTFKVSDNGKNVWGLHTWVLDNRGFPIGMGQYGRVSSGCTRLPRAQDVFRFLPLGATVQLHYSPWVGATTTLTSPVRITTDGINVRSGPGTSHRIVGRAHENQWYVTDQQSMGWYRIRYSDENAWVWGGNIKRGDHGAVKISSAAGTRVRKDPRASAKSLGKAPAGAAYGRKGGVKGWTKVWYAGKEGWVSAKDVVRVAF